MANRAAINQAVEEQMQIARAAYEQQLEELRNQIQQLRNNNLQQNVENRENELEEIRRQLVELQNRSSQERIAPDISNNVKRDDLDEMIKKKVKLEMFTGERYVNWSSEVERYFEVNGWSDYLKKDMAVDNPNSEVIKQKALKLSIILDMYIAAEIRDKLRMNGESVFKKWELLKDYYKEESNAKLENTFEKIIKIRLSDCNDINKYVDEFGDLLLTCNRLQAEFDQFMKWIFLDGLGDSGKAIIATIKNQELSCRETLAKVNDLYPRSSCREKEADGYANFNLSSKAKNGKFNRNYQSNNNFRRRRFGHSNFNGRRRNSCGNRNGRVNNWSRKEMTAAEKERYKNYKCDECKEYGHIRRFCPKLVGATIGRENNKRAERIIRSKSRNTEEEEVGSDYSSNAVLYNDIGKNDFRDRWIFDTGSSIHVCNNLKWFSKVKKCDTKFKTSNVDAMLIAEGIGSVELRLRNGLIMEIDNVYYCPKSTMNLLSNIGLDMEFIGNGENIKIRYIYGRDGYEECLFTKLINGQNIIQLSNKENNKLVNNVAKRGPGRPRKDKSRENLNKKLDKEEEKENRPKRSCRISKEKEKVEIETKKKKIKSTKELDDKEKKVEKESTTINDVVERKFKNIIHEKEIDILDDDVQQKDLINVKNNQMNKLWKLVMQRNGIRNSKDVHLYLGHSGIVSTQKACKLYDIKYTPYNCEVCEVYNLKGGVNRKERLNYSTRPLELVYMDLCQPYGQVESYDNFKYCLVILDDYTRYVEMYLLKEKSESLKYFQQYLLESERRHDSKLVEIRTDNGREFKNENFNKYCKEKGIIQSFSVPYVHYQTGKVERLNQTIERKCIKLIEFSKLDRKYWSDGIRYSVNAYNRSINYKGAVPYTEWFKKVDDRKHYGFGEKIAYMRFGLNHKEIRGKGIMLGYAKNRKAYQILNEDGTIRDDILFIRSLRENKEEKFEVERNEEVAGFVFLNLINKLNDEDIVPKRYADIISQDKRKSREKWLSAIKEELEFMVKNNVFSLVKNSKVENKIDTQYIFTIKDGKPKARLVARGDYQNIETFNETFAPTIDLSILRMILKMSVEKNLKVYSLDVKRAFQNAKLEEDIYIKIPDGYEMIDKSLDEKQNYVLKLNKALYGLKQAAYCWYKEIKSKLIKYGFRNLSRVNTLFVHQKIPNLIVAVYVDDLVIATDDKKKFENLYNYLLKFYELHNRGKLRKILGINIGRDKNSFYLDLKEMIQKLLREYKVDCNKSIKCPIAGGEIINSKENGAFANYQEYAGLLGALLYIARMVRPDIMSVIVQLCQFQQNPREYHLRKLKHVLAYLGSTIDFKYKIGREDQKLKVIGYSDASLGNTYDRKTLFGGLVMIGGSMISYYSRKSKSVLLCTNESEIVACSEMVKEIIYYQKVWCSLVHSNGRENIHCEKCRVPIIRVDNYGVLSFADKGFSKRNKFMDLKYYNIKDKVEKKEIGIQQVQSKDNLADLFTKNLNQFMLRENVDRIGLELVERVD